MVSAVEGIVPETAFQERESLRSSLIVARTPAPASDVLEALAAPEPAGEACTSRAAGAVKAGPSCALAVGAATELGTPIGDSDASPDEATQNAEGDCAAARLQARVRGHQSRLGSTRSFVAPINEFDAPPGAGTPNQRCAFETRRQAVDDAAASVAKVDATLNEVLNEVGATRKEDGESVIATLTGGRPKSSASTSSHCKWRARAGRCRSNRRTVPLLRRARAQSMQRSTSRARPRAARRTARSTPPRTRRAGPSPRNSDDARRGRPTFGRGPRAPAGPSP